MTDTTDTPLLHPVTGKPLTSDEEELPQVEGHLVRAVHDKRGRLILVYADGHLLVREVDGTDIVWKTYTPAVTIQ